MLYKMIKGYGTPEYNTLTDKNRIYLKYQNYLQLKH